MDKYSPSGRVIEVVILCYRHVFVIVDLQVFATETTKVVSVLNLQFISTAVQRLTDIPFVHNFWALLCHSQIQVLWTLAC